MQVTALGGGRFRVAWAERSLDLQLGEHNGAGLRFTCDGVQRTTHAVREAGRVWLACGVDDAMFEEITARGVAAAVAEGDGQLTAPLAGRVLAVLAKPGQRVKRGQCLVTLEAMKLQHELLAACDGVVRSVSVRTGEQVTHHQLLLELEPGTSGTSQS
jgi:biotin carboxyl carrier protein